VKIQVKVKPNSKQQSITEEADGSLTIQVKVKPNSKQQSITEEADGSLTIKLKSSPVEGKESGDGYMSHISSSGYAVSSHFPRSLRR